MTPLRIQIAKEVREMARDAGDKFVEATCSHVIYAHLFGKDKSMANEWRVINAFAEMHFE